PRLAMSPRSSARLICMTSTRCSSPSAPVFTNLTVQATRPLPIKDQTRKCPSGADTPNLETVPRFPLSLRMVEEMLAARGISVTYETIRQWGLKFGREFVNRIRRRAPRRGDKWHLDEVVITIAGTKHWLWRAVDQEGFVLDVLVQSRRDKNAAKRLFRKLLKKQGRAPRVLITDKLRSYGAAKREIMPGV